MAKLFATLDELDRPVQTVSGAEAHAINVYRLTFGSLIPVLVTDDPSARIRAFCDGACKGLVNGAGTEEKIRPDSLTIADAAELVDALVEMNQAHPGQTNDGDGISHPILYTLIHPLVLDNAGTELKQIEFSARTLGDAARFLNANGEVESFREFMRSFGTLVGVGLPITDSIVNALDVEDYATIAGTIVGKLARPRGKLKKAS